MKVKASLVVKLFPILLTMLAFFSCTETKESATLHNDLYFDNLAGDVKKVEEVPYIIDDTGKTTTADSCCITITEYDNMGYRSRQVNKDIKGNEKNEQTYISRFKDGRPKEIQFTENGKLTSTLSGTLDKKGKYADTRISDAAGKLQFYYSGIEVNVYGKIILMKKFTPDSILQETIVNKYDKQIWVGGFIKEKNGKVVFSTTIRLNEKMDPAETTQMTKIDSLTNTTTIRYAYNLYDNYGNWIECTEMDEKGNAHKIMKRKITYRKK